mmetsp:Transcript_16843/g.37261  ORF Transcript_16843/g.37261 Transcript_16843/m.37261 type:complete len:201 (+) Transcript_16843:174-776(+)
MAHADLPCGPVEMQQELVPLLVLPAAKCHVSRTPITSKHGAAAGVVGEVNAEDIHWNCAQLAEDRKNATSAKASHLAAAHGPKCHQTGEDWCSEAMLQGTQDAAILLQMSGARWQHQAPKAQRVLSLAGTPAPEGTGGSEIQPAAAVVVKVLEEQRLLPQRQESKGRRFLVLKGHGKGRLGSNSSSAITVTDTFQRPAPF